MKVQNKNPLLALAISSLFLSGCTGDSPSTTSSPAPSAPTVGDGAVNTGVTDAISDKYSQVWVNIDKITAQNADGVDVLISPRGTDGNFRPLGSVNLLSLKDTILNFGDNKIQEGVYTDIKVSLKPNSKITVFDLKGNSKEITLEGNEMELSESFEISGDSVAKVLVDFDVDAWETTIDAYQPGDAASSMDNFQVRKVINDPSDLELFKPTKIEFDQIQILKKNGKIYTSNLTTGVEREVIFAADEDTSGIVDGELYELEGTINAEGNLVIDEIEIDYESKTAEDKKIHDNHMDKIESEEIKIYGKVIIVNNDEIEIEVDRSTNIFPTSTIVVKINTDVNEPTEIKHGQLADIVEGSLLKIKGEVKTKDLSFVEAYKITIKDAPMKKLASSGLERVKFEAMIKKNADGTYNIEQNPDNPVINTVIALNGTYKVDRSTQACLTSGQYIGAEIKGSYNSATKTLNVVEIESDQRCTKETKLTKGYIKNFTQQSCSALTENNIGSNIAGKYELVSITDFTSGRTDFRYDDEMKVKVRADGSVSSKSEDGERGLMASWLKSKTLSATEEMPTYVSVTGNEEITFADDTSTTANKYVFSYSNQGRYVTITRSDGGVALLRLSGEIPYYKSTACNITITENSDGTGLQKNIQTKAGTKWHGKNYPLEEGRKVKVVLGSNGDVESIRLSELDGEPSPIEVYRDMFDTEYSNTDPSEDDQRKEEEKDHLKKLLNGGMDEEHIAEPEYDREKEEEEHEELKKRYEDRDKAPEGVELRTDTYTVVDGIEVEIYERIQRDGDETKVYIRERSSVGTYIKMVLESTDVDQTYEMKVKGAITTNAGMVFEDVELEGTMKTAEYDLGASTSIDYDWIGDLSGEAVYIDDMGIEHDVSVVATTDEITKDSIITIKWDNKVLVMSTDFIVISYDEALSYNPESSESYNQVLNDIAQQMETTGLDDNMTDPLDVKSEGFNKALYGYQSWDVVVDNAIKRLEPAEQLIENLSKDHEDRSELAEFYREVELESGDIEGIPEAVEYYYEILKAGDIGESRNNYLEYLVRIVKAAGPSDLEEMSRLIEQAGGWDAFWETLKAAQ